MNLEPELARRLKEAARKSVEWRAHRDRLIAEAVRSGASIRQVGAMVELSHTAVRKIVERAEADE